jgi:hypothetical protein
MDLRDNHIRIGSAERLLDLGSLRHLALGYVHEHICDLEDVVDVLLDAVPPLLDFVLVTRNLSRRAHSAGSSVEYPNHTHLKALAALLQSDDRDVCKPAHTQARQAPAEASRRT